MSSNIELKVQSRDVTGKKVNSIRRDGFIPATIYQHGKESVNVQVEYQPFVKAFSEAGYGQAVHLDVGGKERIAMIKNVHIDPAKNTYMHVEFHAVRADRPVEAEIPVHIVGDVLAEHTGNFIVRPHDHVTVKAKPADLPESFEVSAEKLINPGDTLTVADITSIPNGVEIVSEPELTLAVVEEPRAVEEPEETEEVDAADVPSDNGGSDDSAESEDSDDTSDAKSE